MKKCYRHSEKLKQEEKEEDSKAKAKAIREESNVCYWHFGMLMKAVILA